MKIMTFHLGDGAYGVDLSTVEGVLRPRRRQPKEAESPREPETPLFDLAAGLGLGQVRGENAPVLVLRSAEREAAVQVDELGEVVDVEQDAVQNVPHYFGGSPLLRGVAEVEGGLVVLLDGARLLEEAMAARPVQRSAEEAAP